VWHYHFGRGLVASPSDFGFNGERPSHADLLDYIAAEFMRGGWSIKKLHKLIVNSAAYRQGASFNARAAAKDADDRLVWRFAPRRLEGEAVRDSMLFVSGRLNEQMYGPGFRPFISKVFNSTFYTLIDVDRPEYNRRTLYRINVNSAKDPLLESLDCPDPSTKTPRRGLTTTPLQALGLMNNSFVQRQADRLAERVRKESSGGVPVQVRNAYRLALGREPGANEADRAERLATEYGLQYLCVALLNSSEFLYIR
jgi:hypothetical protein